MIKVSDSAKDQALKLMSEQNLNNANYIDAATAIGGDDAQTPVFWDVSSPDQSTYDGGTE